VSGDGGLDGVDAGGGSGGGGAPGDETMGRGAVGGVDLLGNPLTAAERRLLEVYAGLRELAGDDTLAPIAQANARAALALMHNAVNGLALDYEHLTDVGV
jgi:hypothetical protein